MARGGRRTGAGRKKGVAALKAEEMRRVVATRLAEHLEPILDALVDRAIAGDLRAIRELMDRACGRSPQGESFEGGVRQSFSTFQKRLR